MDNASLYSGLGWKEGDVLLNFVWFCESNATISFVCGYSYTDFTTSHGVVLMCGGVVDSRVKNVNGFKGRKK